MTGTAILIGWLVIVVIGTGLAANEFETLIKAWRWHKGWREGNGEEIP